MTETLLRLLADDTKVQKSRRSAKKAQGMIGDHQLITQPPLIVGSKGLKPRLTSPYTKLKYQTQPSTEGSLLFFFLSKIIIFFYTQVFEDVLRFLKGFEPLGP